MGITSSEFNCTPRGSLLGAPWALPGNLPAQAFPAGGVCPLDPLHLLSPAVAPTPPLLLPGGGFLLTAVACRSLSKLLCLPSLKNTYVIYKIYRPYPGAVTVGSLNSLMAGEVGGEHSPGSEACPARLCSRLGLVRGLRGGPSAGPGGGSETLLRKEEPTLGPLNGHRLAVCGAKGFLNLDKGRSLPVCTTVVKCT